jgi:uncharacterized iron-regulated membrane protein
MRSKVNSLVLLLALAGFCAAAHAGEIYKWVDEQGNVQYSQVPQNQAAQPMNIKVPKTSAPSDNQEKSNAPESPTSEPPQKGNPEEDKAIQEAAAKKQQEAQKQNCQISMKRLATITAGGRIYEVDEQGERAYWDDQTRQAKLAEAQQDVDKWCTQE